MGTVLIVDDCDDVRMTLVEALALEGHVALSATGGEEALQTLRAGARVNLVLLDVFMPGMGAEETLRRIRQGHPDVWVVFMTAAPPDAIPKGADALLMKSFSLADVLALAARFCRAPRPGPSA